MTIPDFPAWIVREVEEEDIEKSGAAVAVPESATVCGLPLALSAMDTEAVRVPGAVGLKVTLMVQFAEAATLAPQVLVWL